MCFTLATKLFTQNSQETFTVWDWRSFWHNLLKSEVDQSKLNYKGLERFVLSDHNKNIKSKSVGTFADHKHLWKTCTGGKVFQDQWWDSRSCFLWFFLLANAAEEDLSWTLRICALSLDFSLYNYKSPLTTVSAVRSWFDSIRQLHLSSCCCCSNAQVMDCLTIPVTRSRYNCNGSFKAQKHVLSIKLVEVFLRKRRTSFSNCTEKKGERESTFHNFRKCSKFILNSIS